MKGTATDAEAYQRGWADSLARTSAVLAHEAAAGREAQAIKMLATTMSSDEIVDLLATLPVSSQVAAEAEDRRMGLAILDALAKDNVDVGADGGSVAPDDNHGWAKIHDDVRARRDPHASGWKKATAEVNRRNGFQGDAA